MCRKIVAALRKTAGKYPMRYEKPQENAFAQILQCLVRKALASLDARPTSPYGTRRCGDDASLAVVVRRRNPCGPVRGGQMYWTGTEYPGTLCVPCRPADDPVAGAGYPHHVPDGLHYVLGGTSCSRWCRPHALTISPSRAPRDGIGTAWLPGPDQGGGQEQASVGQLCRGEVMTRGNNTPPK